MNLETLSRCPLCGSRGLRPADRANYLDRCNNCGFVFDNPRPFKEAIKSFYSAADKYNAWMKEQNARECLWKRRLKLVKKYRSSGRLLDVGAGIGQFLYLAKMDFEVCGTEISQSAVRAAGERYNIELINGEIENLAIDKKFDLITVFHVLEHVSHPEAFLNRCGQLLNPGGTIIIAVPNDLESVHAAVKKVLAFFKIGKFKTLGKLGLPKISLDGSLPEIHLSHFTPRVLNGFLEKNGFVIADNSLDPYFAALGLKKILHSVLYYVCLAIFKLFKRNFYPTFYVAARKLGQKKF